jgi:hypothetical protein
LKELETCHEHSSHEHSPTQNQKKEIEISSSSSMHFVHPTKHTLPIIHPPISSSAIPYSPLVHCDTSPSKQPYPPPQASSPTTPKTTVSHEIQQKSYHLTTFSVILINTSM